MLGSARLGEAVPLAELGLAREGRTSGKQGAELEAVVGGGDTHLRRWPGIWGGLEGGADRGAVEPGLSSGDALGGGKGWGVWHMAGFRDQRGRRSGGRAIRAEYHEEGVAWGCI